MYSTVSYDCFDRTNFCSQHRDTSEQRRKLGRWFGVSFQESLQCSVYQGLPWHVGLSRQPHPCGTSSLIRVIRVIQGTGRVRDHFTTAATKSTGSCYTGTSWYRGSQNHKIAVGNRQDGRETGKSSWLRNAYFFPHSCRFPKSP